MGGKVHVITSKEEWDNALKSAAAEGKPVVVDFWAQWCGPCKMVAPFYESLSEQFANVAFLKVDVDEVPAVAESCSISAMPTFQLWKKVDGEMKKVEEVVGASKDKLQKLVESATAA